MVLLLEEIYFERQDGEQLGHVALDALDAVFLPRPYLRGYVVVDGYRGLGPHKLGDVEVEARVVYQYHHVGLPVSDVALGTRHVAQNGGQVQQHGYEAHIGQFAVVLHERAAHGLHQVAAEEAELCRRVGILQRLHEVRCVQVATGFAGYQVVFHER